MAPGIVPQFIHPDFYIFCKPPDTSFHSEAGTGFFSEIRLAYASETLWPVHRLDKSTSGLLIVARNKAAATTLGELFASGSVKKYYFALSSRKPVKKQGLIQGDMVRTRDGSWKLSRSMSNPAITRFFSQSVGNGMRAFLLMPKTGKTHQLRVAMKAIGSPVLGDARYGGDAADRSYLHAAKLEFVWKGENISYLAQPDRGEYFSNSAEAFSHLLQASGESGY